MESNEITEGGGYEYCANCGEELLNPCDTLCEECENK